MQGMNFVSAHFDAMYTRRMVQGTVQDSCRDRKRDVTGYHELKGARNIVADNAQSFAQCLRPHQPTCDLSCFNFSSTSGEWR
ncbi:hypothetical protein MPTK1_3g04740 [Marchantia polymorpha subsp. ruderalis]